MGGRAPQEREDRTIATNTALLGLLEEPAGRALDDRGRDRLPPGRTLIQEGERGRQLFVVIEGTVEVRKKGRKWAIRGGSEIFGEMALITNAPANATVTTTSPVRALVIVDRSFRGLLERTPAIQSKILVSLAARVAPDVL